MTGAGAEEPGQRGARGLPLLLAALFAAALWLHARHNDFPYFYHPDEGEKVRQVRTGEWNFHHPMLLLTTVKFYAGLQNVPPQEQRIVEAGREVSAIFSALAIGTLVLLAFAWRGWAAALPAAGALLFQHQLFELAHYFKEDTALLCGVALTFYAAWRFWRTPDRWRAVVLGLAAACAISGKFLGVCALAVALPVLWWAPGGGRRERLAWFGGALLLALFLINLPLVLNPGAFAQSFDREVQLAVHGQRGTTRNVPHTLYWNVFRDNTTPVVWALLLVFLAARWRERRRVTLPEWLLIAFPFAFALALSFSPKSNDRYFLPATAMFTLFAALGVPDASRMLTRWVPRGWTTGVLGGLLVISQICSPPHPLDWKNFAQYYEAFQRDDNAEMLWWVKTQLPADAVIVKDSRVRLPETGNSEDEARLGTVPQKIIAKKYAADVGTIAALRVRGVTHVAVSASDYEGFFREGVRAKKNDEKSFEHRKAFYEELLRDGELVFARERGTVLYLHPGLRLYRLPPGE